MLSDVKFAARTLRQAPGFAAAAVLALALGIGASSAIFSVLDAVLYKPLPFPQPDRLARIFQVSREGKQGDWSPANYLDLARDTRAFSSVAAWFGFAVNLRTDESVERVPVVAITQTFFGTLGVRPVLGRDFAPGEDLDGVERMAIVGDGFFRRVLHGDASAIGKTISLNDRPVRVIGVLPREFRFPPLPGSDIFVPVRIDADDRKNRGSHYWNVLGRLAPGMTLSQAQSELRLIAARLEEADPYQNTGWSERALGFRDELTGPVSGTLHLLLGAVLLLLLVACANVAGLLLARGAARGREIAIRAAMGAGTGRLIRQLLVESVVIAGLGGIAGLCLAGWAVDALVSLAPEGLPRLHEIRVDSRVAAFGVVLSLVSGVLAGLWPALQASRIGLVEALKDGAHGTAGAQKARARRLLVITEIALALVLVVGAGLLVRSFRRVLEVPLGFDARNVLTAQVAIPFGRSSSGKPYGDFFAELVDRISRLPGVDSAAATTLVPTDPSGNFQNAIHVEGHPPERSGEFFGAQLTWVTPQYFGTLGIPLLRGRLFDGRDGWRTAPVVVVNEAFVRKYLGSEEPLGARLRIFNRRWDDHADEWAWTVIGIVRDAREWGADQEPRPAIFIDVAQQASAEMTLMVRTAGSPSAMAAAVRGTLAAMDPTLALAQVHTLEQMLAISLGARRFQMQLVALFGAVALVLAALGLSGVIAQSVSQRTREFGIRLALGAQPGRVLSMVVRQGVRLGVAGVAAGLVFSLAATRALRGALYGVSSVDPFTYGAVAALLVVVAVIASWLPARRATRVDPAIALRAE